MIKLSFIIPCLNSEKTIRATVEAIVNCDFPAGEREIIVVDNGSSDRTIEFATRPEVTVICCDKRGAGAARNFGARHARGRYLAFIDSDTVIERDWPVVLLKNLEERQYSAALGRVLPSGEETYLTGYRKNLARRRYQGTNISLFHFNGISSIINTTACIFRKSVFDAIGGFDERLRRLEDTEISVRLFNYGGVIYGSHEARARVYNTGSPLDYLKRSFALGSSKRQLGSTVGHSEKLSFYRVLYEFLPKKFGGFSVIEIIFYYFNCLFMLAGYICSFPHETPLPMSLPPGLRKKILGMFQIDGQVLSDNTRLVVVDDTLYFFAVKKQCWKVFRLHNIPWEELRADNLVEKI